MRRMSLLALTLVAALAAAPMAPVAAQGEGATADGDINLALARQSMVGQWQGKLEYLDYSANKWFGIPVSTHISLLADGVTTLRKSAFDDGPKVGLVYITGVELFDPDRLTISAGSFRKGRTPEIMTYQVRLAPPSSDATHWTMIEETEASDDDRPARLRLTTTRNGDSMETLKEVDFLDDEGVAWLQRNRTRLTRISD